MVIIFSCGNYEFGKRAKSDSFFVDRSCDLPRRSVNDSSNFLAILGSANCKLDMFPEVVFRVKIGDLKHKNGGLVPLSWFNKGTKAADTLFVGTFFALLAGNLRRKYPSE